MNYLKKLLDCLKTKIKINKQKFLHIQNEYKYDGSVIFLRSVLLPLKSFKIPT